MPRSVIALVLFFLYLRREHIDNLDASLSDCCESYNGVTTALGSEYLVRSRCVLRTLYAGGVEVRPGSGTSSFLAAVGRLILCEGVLRWTEM